MCVCVWGGGGTGGKACCRGRLLNHVNHSDWYCHDCLHDCHYYSRHLDSSSQLEALSSLAHGKWSDFLSASSTVCAKVYYLMQCTRSFGNCFKRRPFSSLGGLPLRSSFTLFRVAPFHRVFCNGAASYPFLVSSQSQFVFHMSHSWCLACDAPNPPSHVIAKILYAKGLYKRSSPPTLDTSVCPCVGVPTPCPILGDLVLCRTLLGFLHLASILSSERERTSNGERR